MKDENLWTAKEIKLLTEKWNAGVTSTVIGRLLDRSRCSVLGKVHRLKLPKREIPDTQKTKARNRATRKLVTSGIRVPVWNASGPVPPTIVTDTNTLIPLVSSMEDLNNNDCRFPSGNYGEEGFGFCGRLKMQGKSYCEVHYRITMTPITPRRG